MNKEISVVKVIITIVLLAFLEAFLIIYFHYEEKVNMCEIAVCNSDKTECSAFISGDNGQITKTWNGSCR